MLNEKVFTPGWVVNIMLDLMGYVADGNVLRKHIMDNSCGDGAMLVKVVERYANAYVREHGNRDGLAEEIVKYVHGIELDSELAEATRTNLSEHSARLGFIVDSSKWDIVCGDAFEQSKYDGKMHFVVGNPPYRKIHDFGELKGKIRSSEVSSKGMTDLYIAFYKIGIDMLTKKGRMCYITPSTWASGANGKELRQYINENAPITEVIDCGHERIFEDANTYPSIFVLDKAGNGGKVKFSRMKNGKLTRKFVHDYEDCVIDGKLYFCEDIGSLRNILSHHDDESGIAVKNGYATNADKLFVVANDEVANTLESAIACVKASKGMRTHIIFPYDEKGKAKTTEEIGANTLAYLKSVAESMNRDTEKDGWWLYGRTQALSDTFVEKYAVGSLVSAESRPKIAHAPKGCGVYGGVYVKAEKVSPMVFYTVMSIFKRSFNRYYEYAVALGHKKSGGYYYVNAYEMQSFINMIYSEIRK